MQIPEQLQRTGKTLQHLETPGEQGGRHSPTVSVRAQPDGPFMPTLELFRCVPESHGPTELNSPRMRMSFNVVLWAQKWSKRREALYSVLFLYIPLDRLTRLQPSVLYNPSSCQALLSVFLLILFRFYFLTTFNLKSSLHFSGRVLFPIFLSS